jgi:GNAT superfamily N-acetyltransferase
MCTAEIRSFAAADFDAWYPLWRGYQEFYEVDLPREVSELTWHRLLDAAEPMHGAFVLRDEQPVGLVHYIEHRSSWTVSNSCYLQDLFVEASRRGQGYGRMLIEHVYAHAQRAGLSRVWWLTHESNAQAMLLYDTMAEKSGFVQYRKAF